MTLRLGYLDFTRNLSVANLMIPLLESLDFTRYWFAEHAPQASPIGLAAMAGGMSERLRIGTAGVLANLHNPFQVAQEFRMWGATFSGRFDAGVCQGMAGNDELMAMYRRADDRVSTADYEARVEAIFGLIRENLDDGNPMKKLAQSGLPNSAQPWILGTGPNSAALAARLSTHYGYSIFHKFSRNDPGCIRAYREAFSPATDADSPHALLSMSIACSDGPIDIASLLHVKNDDAFIANIVGDQELCRTKLGEAVERYGVQEIVMLDLFQTDELRQRSVTLLSEVAKSL